MSTVSASIYPRVEEDRYLALLQAANAIATCSDCTAASDALVSKLREVTPFDFLHLVAFDKDTNSPCFALLDAFGRKMEPPPADVLPLADSPLQHVHDCGECLTTLDWTQDPRFPAYARFLGHLGIVSTCTLPLTRGSRRLGVLSLGRSYPNAYDEDEIRFLCLAADQIGLAIDAAVNFFVSQRVQDQLKLILDLTNQVVSNLEFHDLLQAASGSVRRVMHCDAAAIMLADPELKFLRVHALDYPESRGIFVEGTLVPIEGTMPGESFKSGKPLVINRLDAPEVSPEMYAKAKGEGLNSFCDVPLMSKNRLLGVLALACRGENAFDEDQVAFSMQVANQIAIGVENARAYKEIAELKDRLAQEKLYLENEIRGEMDFEGIVQGIIGQSSGLKHVLNLVETVAPSDSTVLLLGETGTGKELIARAIHDRSKRKDRTFVKLNCAAIPTGLLESELFGHERGAFTGAITQKIGRLELADQGSLFLDEVGDIPIEIQPKLLRALQEREFERLGSTYTKKVNVRLVAATNRDLEKMIENGQFRSDLFYRLNVFPIRIPPLRERPEDIPLLVRYFTQKYARRMEKKIESIPTASMKKLSSWHWPGNIRELENLIERSVILTHGSALQVPISELVNNHHARAAVAQAQATSHTLPESPDSEDRAEILRILKETRGRVAGPNGAAARMGLKRTTLISRMKKLGIDARQSL
ncbi:MAG TPA: sigma 54-interacting transcriptional regulator [Terriglobales bacterium]|nr:sigma 54-interacting transcriptional regulator [Terriglobales bacterium]